jgi:cytidyltransferase-like protein
VERIAPAKIVSLKDMCLLRPNLNDLGVTSGYFDPLHPGHVKLLLSAKEYCETFAVLVNSDESLRQKKGQLFMEQQIRAVLVAAIRGVDYVILHEHEADGTVTDALRQLRPSVFLKGGDRVDKDTIPAREWALSDELDMRIIVPDDCRSKSGEGSIPFSSSFFLNRWVRVTLHAFLDSILNAFVDYIMSKILFNR